MPSDLVALADAVVADLNTQTWSVRFEAARRFYVPEYRPQDLNVLRVVVVPDGELSNSLARDTWQHEATVEVSFWQRADEEECDELTGLVQEVGDWLRRNRPTNFSTARASSVQQSVAYDPNYLNEIGVFVAVLRVTFAVWR